MFFKNRMEMGIYLAALLTPSLHSGAGYVPLKPTDLPIRSQACMQRYGCPYRLQDLEAQTNQLALIVHLIRTLFNNHELHFGTKAKKSTFRAQLQELEGLLAKGSDDRLLGNYRIAIMLVNLMNMTKPAINISIPYQLNTEAQINHIAQQLIEELASRGVSSTQLNIRRLVTLLSPYRYVIGIAFAPLALYVAHRLYTQLFFAPVSTSVTSSVTTNATNPSRDFNRDVSIEVTTAAERTAPQVDGPAAQNNDSWIYALNAAKIATIVPIGAYLAGLYQSTVITNFTTRLSDKAGALWAYLQALPYRSDNPASTSKVSLQDAPLTDDIKSELALLAKVVAQPEMTCKLQGRLSSALLCVGDVTLGEQVAQGLADQITQELKAQGACYNCPIICIHATKLWQTSACELLKKSQSYNGACVILIQEIDIVGAMHDDMAKVLADIISLLGTAAKPYEQIVIVATAKNISDVHPSLLHPSRFATPLILNPEINPALADAGVRRAAQLTGITIQDASLHATLANYMIQHSFGDLLRIFLNAYTRGLPHLGNYTPTEQHLLEELARDTQVYETLEHEAKGNHNLLT